MDDRQMLTTGETGVFRFPRPGPVTRSAIWTEYDWLYYTRNTLSVLTDVAADAGIKVDRRSWDVSDRDEAANFMRLTGGVLELGQKDRQRHWRRYCGWSCSS